MILFAKAPVPGRVKTRLIPAIGAERAAALHSKLVAQTWATLGTLMASRELHTDVPTAAWPGMHPRRLQVPGDLGMRMHAALSAGLQHGFDRCLILGSDAPGLPAGHLQALLDAETDVVLGPVEDGGYYAICCRRVEARMFDGVRWSTEHALADTVRGAQACGLTVALGPRWFDLDVPADLARVQL